MLTRVASGEELTSIYRHDRNYNFDSYNHKMTNLTKFPELTGISSIY